jgi:hypothetical protein
LQAYNLEVGGESESQYFLELVGLEHLEVKLILELLAFPDHHVIDLESEVHDAAGADTFGFPNFNKILFLENFLLRFLLLSLRVRRSTSNENIGLVFFAEQNTIAAIFL